jgi:hypothetical protein
MRIFVRISNAKCIHAIAKLYKYEMQRRSQISAIRIENLTVKKGGYNQLKFVKTDRGNMQSNMNAMWLLKRRKQRRNVIASQSFYLCKIQKKILYFSQIFVCICLVLGCIFRNISALIFVVESGSNERKRIKEEGI